MNHLTDEQINEYLDGVLEPTARLTSEVHLRTCEACRERLATLQAVFAALEGLPAPTLAADLAPAVLARLPLRSPLWTRTFAAQLGVALGGLAWAAMQLAPRLRLLQLPQWRSLLTLRALFPALPAFSPSSVLAPLIVNPVALLPSPASFLAIVHALLSDLFSLFSLNHVPMVLPDSITVPARSLLLDPLARTVSPFILLGILLLCLLGNTVLLRVPNGGRA